MLHSQMKIPFPRLQDKKIKELPNFDDTIRDY